MSLIVAGRFETFNIAQEACRALFLDGFAEDDVTMFFVNPAGQHARFPVGGDRDVDPGALNSTRGAALAAGFFGAIGAAVGAVVAATVHVSIIFAILAAAVGAYVGTLIGAMVATSKASTPKAAAPQPAPRSAGVLVAIHAGEDNQARAAALLKSHGAVDVERALGRWRAGEWVDFDPVASTHANHKLAA